jgi:hypothetical protein
MSSTLTKATGAKFVAIITSRDGSHFIECFLRGSSPAGLPSNMQHVYNNSSLPSFPVMPMQQARDIAIEQARSYGYTESEIVWED